VVNIITDIITGITTEPTRYALIIGFITSVIIFILNEWAKRRYLIHEKLLSLRLERFESLLQELYSYAGIYEDIQMVLEIETVDVPIEIIQAKIVDVNRFFGKIFSESILNEDEVWEAETPKEFEEQKGKIMNFLQLEGLEIFNDIQYKASTLHLIMPDKTIQAKGNEIATNISNYIQKTDKNKTEKISEDLRELVDSMRKYLPSLSIID
jgi:hypothetical protein